MWYMLREKLGLYRDVLSPCLVSSEAGQVIGKRDREQRASGTAGR